MSPDLLEPPFLTPLAVFLYGFEHRGVNLLRGNFCLQKRIALHGGVAATLTPIALHFATKEIGSKKTHKKYPHKE